MDSSHHPTPAIRSACNLIFFFSVLAVVGFVLALPVFPTGDGPLHLYFARIMWSLAKHGPEFSQYFAIRHLVAPYSIHYFALIFLEQFCSPAMAEKLIVACIILVTATGFRFLAGGLQRASLGRAQEGSLAPAALLWMVPLLLSWTIGGGFLNYSLAVGLAYWAYGFWLMLLPGGAPAALAGFVVVLLMLVLSHPVPLLVLVLFLAGDLVLEWAGRRFGSAAGPREAPSLRSYLPRLVALALTAAAMAAPALIADKSQVSSIWPDLHPHSDLLRQLSDGECLGLFGGLHPLQIVYTAGLLIIVPGALFLIGRTLPAHFRAGALTPADRLFVLAFVFLLSTLAFPHSLNGSYFFPQRIWDLLWPMLLATTAGVAVGARTLRWLTGAGLVLVLVFAFPTIQTLPRAARIQAELGRIPLPEGSKGIFLEPTRESKGLLNGFTYPIFFWSAARSLTPTHSILINTPWLGLTVLPIKASAAAGKLFTDLPTGDQDHPFELYQLLRESAPVGDRILGESDFLLYADPAGGHPDLAGVEQSIFGHNHRDISEWSCSTSNVYVLCLHRR